MKYIYPFLLIGGLWLGAYVPLAAQRSKLPDSLFCGTPSLTDAERQDLERMVDFAFRLKKASGQLAAGTTYVPVRPHIYRQTNGTGGMTLTSLNNVMALVNKYYLNNGSGIQFYFCGTAPDYINNDQIYNNGFPSTTSDESSANGRDATNAMNLYLVNRFDKTDLLGYAYFPANTLKSTRSFIRTGGLSDNYIGDYVIDHEFGHNFNLLHTFEGSTATTTPELVTRGAGANCTTVGDLLCDTPADPYGRTGATTSSQNGCLAYTGTITDSQGNLYTPSMGNIMAYYDGCNPNFTTGQYDRIQGGLALRQSHSAYSLTCAPTTVATPTNVVAVANNLGVLLTWQDNANNELGYFIERSTNANSGFVPLGGVAPNATSYLDLAITSQTTYYYRLRPSNSTTVGLTNSVSVLVGTISCKPVFTAGCADADGLDKFVFNSIPLSASSGCSPTGYNYMPTSVVNVTAGQTYSFTGTFLGTEFAEGASIWVDVNRNGVYDATERLFQMTAPATTSFTGALTIPVSTTSGPLPMRIIVRYNSIPTAPCGNYTYGEAEDYVLNIPGVCAPPTGLTTTGISTATAVLNWTTLGVSNEIQWRQQGAGTWTTISSSTAIPVNSPYSLTGLSAGTAYEWQVRSQCQDGSFSTWTGPVNFTTLTPCLAPSLTTGVISVTSAVVNWTVVAGVSSYSLSWKPTSNTAASPGSVSGLAGSVSSYTITGLLPSTVYTIQLQSQCAGNQLSLPQSITLTTATAPCITMYTLKNGAWTDPTVWSCNRVPVSTDAVEIRHTITVPDAITGQTQKVSYAIGGRIIFGTGTRLQLGMP